MGQCQNDGKELPAAKLFCDDACRNAFYNRMSARGRVAMPLVLAWRASRGSGGDGKNAFRELCAYADHCNAEDLKAERPPMVNLIRYRNTHGTGIGWRERT